MDDIKLRVYKNKRNNQLTIVLNKKLLGLKDKNPKSIKINKKDIQF